MERSFLKFVWRYSKREQIYILALTFLSFPLVYYSLEIPKIIVNEAINGRQFPRTILGFEFEQIPYLLLMCFAFLGMVVLINAIKWLLNVSVGMCGERMLRRLRFTLFEQVMRFPIARFRTTKPGEVIQSMLGEIEPLGGFIGEVISTPAFQGGLLCVYVTFIFIQDFWLGLAAISLYPIQAWLIPMLQAKVIRLNKERARNTRGLADTISEAVSNVADIHTNDTARWHMAQISGRLHQNTLIRMDLFRRKFTIKFVNNFLNQLTPFFFYLAGGYLVIKGDLDFGSLVAVLAAYKDLAGPWKEVLNYIQRWNDFNSRYEYVVDSFVGDGVLGAERIFETDAPPLKGEVEISGVEGGPGTGGLTVSGMTIRPGQTIAVIGGEEGAREALLRLIAGLIEPAAGRVTIGGKPVSQCTMPEIGASIAYVGSEPGMIARSIRENLVYGLLRRMPDLSSQGTAEAVMLLREARRTGNITADPEGDWIDYQAASAEDAEALDRRLLQLVDLAGLADDLVANALNSRIDASDGERWTAPILSARAELQAAVDAAELNDIAEPWVPGVFNTNGTLLANTLFGFPLAGADDIRGYARMANVREVLESVGALSELQTIGWEIADEFATLVEAVDEKSAVLDSFAAYPKADILAAADLVQANRGHNIDSLRAEQRETLLSFALAFIPTRDRLDVLDDDRIARLLSCQAKARKILVGREDFVTFDQDRFSPARTIAENILNAKRRFDRKSAWRTLDEKMEAAIRTAGLRDDLIRLGLGAFVGTGGSNLSATARRRVALARAMLKQPRVILLDGVAGSALPADVALREAIRKDLPEAALVYAAAAPDAASDADAIVMIDANGTVRYDQSSKPRVSE
ncbi:MAG TPA: ABC transporter transmembrane domain-containing protein [Thermohalobaculum sp.]|nr:ABC transporter transmembrane domain-containing protein [Thermohalobaculum sp.]